MEQSAQCRNRAYKILSIYIINQHNNYIGATELFPVIIYIYIKDRHLCVALALNIFWSRYNVHSIGCGLNVNITLGKACLTCFITHFL